MIFVSETEVAKSTETTSVRRNNDEPNYKSRLPKK